MTGRAASAAILALGLVLGACGGPDGPMASGEATSSAPGSSAAEPTEVGGMAWETHDDAPFQRIEVASAAHDGVIWLAGGLNAANLANAVRLCGARAVDVSSGVEDRPGHKDPARIRQFLAVAAALGVPA